MSSGAPHARYLPAGSDRIGRLALSRPSKLNATDDTTLRDLAAAVDAAAADRAARAVIVAGEGRAFCAGIDLAALARDALPGDWFRRWDETLTRLERIAAGTVAAIQGACLGGGFQLALCCDLRVAAEDATFGLSAVTHGIIPGLAAYRLPRFVGMGPAREMMLLGETWNVERARAHALVDRVVPNAELEASARALAERLAAAPREALVSTRRLVLGCFDVPVERFLDDYVAAQQRCREDPETRAKLASYRSRFRG
jgi:enoyl-CoA hydratase/carnithine racemase